MAASFASRRRLLALIVVGASLVLAVGFFAGRIVRSPEQHAADAAGPGPTVLTAAVESRTLVAQVVTRGEVAAGTQSAISPPVGSGTAAAAAPVVTRVRVTSGEQIKQGQVLAEVSGRPMFALAGDSPAYRDLRPGYRGDDVRQLQEDLAAMGFDPGGIDGVYGEPTKSAVADFYESIGYEPAPASDADDRMLRDAATAVQQAAWAVEDAQEALDAARETAHDDEEAATVRTARKALDRARQRLSAAQTSRDELIEKTGPMVPLGEYSFIPSFPARMATVEAKAGAAASSPLLTIASGQLRAVGVVNPGQAALIRKDQPVSVLLEAAGITAAGVVSDMSLITGNDPSAGSSRIVVTPEGDWPDGFWGENVRLTIDGGSTDGPMLVVPVSALFASADGSSRVTVIAADGSRADLTVTVGVAAGGYAAITPLSGELRAGDQVAISADNVTTGGG